MITNIKIEVWEKGNPFNSQEKYFNSEYETDFNKEVVKLTKQVEEKYEQDNSVLK
jgi:hypothetical protein